MRSLFTRRRFFRISGFSSAGAFAGCRLASGISPAPADLGWQWRGILFGAEASIHLHGVEPQRGERLTKRCFEKMRSLENLFSLYQPDSVLCRLNREGVVREPPPLFHELLQRCRALAVSTEGAFDITVQPLWELYHQHYVRDGKVAPPEKSSIERALARVDYKGVRVGEDCVALEKPGMGLTLNGIAQGFITDQIADYLKSEGIDQTLVHLGEYRALGDHPEGRPWKIGVRSASDLDAVIDSMPLRDEALAMSGGYGFTFDPEGRRHHLFHPQTGEHRPSEQTVCVTASSATLADALSTACAVVEPGQAERIVDAHDAQLRVVVG